jgi:Domain of unknown function (DUF4386)
MKGNSIMNSQESETIDRRWKGLYRLSGVLLVIEGIGGIVAFLMGAVLYKSGFPANPEAYLQLISQEQLRANILWSLWIFGGFAFILPSVAMYIILKRDGRILALFGTLLSLFYSFYDVSVTELNSLTLVSLARGYANAATDALRASYVAAATYGYAALPFQTVLSFGIGAVAWLCWSLVMLKRHIFQRWMAIMGIIVNTIGIISAVAPVVRESYFLGLLQFLTAPLTAIWFIMMGVRVYSIARNIH